MTTGALLGHAGSPALSSWPCWLSLPRAQEPHLSSGLVRSLCTDLVLAPALVQRLIAPGATEVPASALGSAHHIQGLEVEGRALPVPRSPWLPVLFSSLGQPPSRHAQNAHDPMP